MARQCIRYYVLFEDRVEHLGREQRRRFPGREGQKHPLTSVLYNREKGKVTNAVSLSLGYVVFDKKFCRKISNLVDGKDFY